VQTLTLTQLRAFNHGEELKSHAPLDHIQP